MQSYQRDFLELALARKALSFGEFTLKSGRVSPYFFNAGAFNRGSDLLALGRAYAAALVDSTLACDMLFGPAYKGIALATATAMALADRHDRDWAVAFNRKEAKSHGEGGELIGAPLQGRVLIVDDVITAGTAIRQAVALIRSHGATPAGVLIALDRQERGSGTRSASEEASMEFDLPVVAIATLDTLLAFSTERPDLIQLRDRLQAYRAQYGSRSPKPT